jgi:hypothetical protein
MKKAIPALTSKSPRLLDRQRDSAGDRVRCDRDAAVVLNGFCRGGTGDGVPGSDWTTPGEMT